MAKAAGNARAPSGASTTKAEVKGKANRPDDHRRRQDAVSAIQRRTEEMVAGQEGWRRR